jgi:hypothetical protein
MYRAAAAAAADIAREIGVIDVADKGSGRYRAAAAAAAIVRESGVIDVTGKGSGIYCAADGVGVPVLKSQVVDIAGKAGGVVKKPNTGSAAGWIPAVKNRCWSTVSI